ncbi:HD domain-containing phosphohydrolase [Deinococcus maricopensis]|uniref:Putative PAS/PAC sensor protein n=1 Tax=Deinococcus maricopensis (strain DSM 21211 / LMG 22137 / NRRL B-23946 / LB-34) TaxID=709986 RepID=E8U9B8_DEIML|nr:HD domain-containing phosphohydrolase [Deinococcus maricopensis]ADV67657.1 putative PAS/PAC sensor protein [Deinococcus maricopensis DSM 21211]
MTPTPPAHADDLADYQALFDHAGVGLLEITFGGCIRRINPDGAAFFGLPREQLLGMSVLDVTHPEDIERTIEALGRVVRGDAPVVVLEKRYLRADGEVVWSRSRVSLLPGRAGPADSVVAVVADITELKRAQQDLERLNVNLQATLEGGLLGLGIALEARDLETAGHTERVMTLSHQLGAALGLDGVTLNELRQGASLHDLGKLTIPDAVLLKPGRLDAAEWALMQTHAHNGHAMAARIPTLAPAAMGVIRHHHERWDGTGYPDRLSADEIPLLARIFAVCDVYDALTSERPYKHAWAHGDALAEVRAQRGRQFDPHVVDTFLTLFGSSGATPLGRA